MHHATQVDLTKRILTHIDNKTTDLAREVTRNPVTSYTCPDILAREQAVLFRDYPLLMGFSCQIPDAGDHLTDNKTGLPILVVRTGDGAVKAFLNVCRHRGNRVADGCGRVRRGFVCAYHGWVYDLDGKLVGVPDERNFPGLDRDAHGLRELPAIEKHGMIWVKPNPNGGSIDIDDHLDGLGPELGSYGFENYHHYETRTLRRRMNWKIGIDTFLEPYHFAVLHKATVGPIFVPNLCLFEGFGLNGRETLPRRSIEALRDQPPENWDLIPYTAIVYQLFPNTAFVMQADHVETWRMYPVDGRTDECIMDLDFYTPEPATSDSARGHWDRNMDLAIRTVDEEDFPVSENIQFGLPSAAQDVVTYGRNEPALAHFQIAVQKALA